MISILSCHASARKGRCDLSCCDDFLEARFEVFFALRPQPGAFDRKCVLDAPYPIEQLANVLACLLLVPLQMFGPGHGLQETSLFRALRRDFDAKLRAKKACVASEEVLEPELHLD